MTRKDAKSRRDGAARYIAMLGLAAVWVAASPPASAQSDDNFKVVGDVGAYLGVMPATIVKGHPVGHPERDMHGGPPGGRHAHHIVIALFEEPSAKRIEDAEVVATVSGLGHVGGTPIALGPMLIAGVITYGGFVSLPGGDRYAIDLEIRRPGQTAVTRMTFSYEHFAG